MISSTELRDHLDAKFEGRTVTPFPSPHLIIENFFPDEVYEQILEFNPFKSTDGRKWISESEAAKRRQSTPYYLRKQVDLENGEFEGSPEARAFWKVISDALLKDHWLANRLYKTYPAYFEIRFGEAVLEKDFFGQLRHGMFVQRHEAGYEIGPHTDSPHRVFTCIFAFADQPGNEQYGTQFVRPKDPRVRCWGDLHHEDRDFEVATLAKYARNSFVVFFKTRQSFHSVKKLDHELPNQRYGMQLGYYEPARGLFRDLSRPDLMEDRTAKPLLKLSAFGRTLQINRS